MHISHYTSQLYYRLVCISAIIPACCIIDWYAYRPLYQPAVLPISIYIDHCTSLICITDQCVYRSLYQPAMLPISIYIDQPAVTGCVCWPLYCPAVLQVNVYIEHCTSQLAYRSVCIIAKLYMVSIEWWYCNLPLLTLSLTLMFIVS